MSVWIYVDRYKVCVCVYGLYLSLNLVSLLCVFVCLNIVPRFSFQTHFQKIARLHSFSFVRSLLNGPLALFQQAFYPLMHQHVVPQLMHTLCLMILNKKMSVLPAASHFMQA